MSQLIVRRVASHRSSLLTPVIAGLALGAAAGFVLGELFGPRAGLAAAPAAVPSQPGRSMAELVGAALTALSADQDLARLDLEVIPVSRQVIELHGWVPSRRLRTRALQLVGDAVGRDAVVNRLLVRGEDDAAQPSLDVLSA